MRLPRVPGSVGRLAIALCAIAATASPARAFSGRITYSGALGPVTRRRPLCLCVYTMPDLSHRLGCLIFSGNDVSYKLTNLIDKDYYLIAFLDIHINERLDSDEPFQIYKGRGSKPGDPLNGTSTASDIDFLFGDENLPPPTATATESPPPSPSPTPADTATVTPQTPTAVPRIAGDCDGDGSVTVAELVRAVAVALGAQPMSACPAADRDGDGAVRIEELIAAINAALGASAS